MAIHARRDDAPASDHTSKEQSRPFRVLLVDDCPDLQDMVKLCLERTAIFSVVGGAYDGVAGISEAARLQPDLVLLDLAMPHMDGLEALPAILAAAPRTRVVVFSATNERTVAHQALAGGASRYVVKGTSLKELVEVLAGVMQS